MKQEYTAQLIINGALLSDSPIIHLSCGSPRTKIAQVENQNKIHKLQASELIMNQLEEIAQREKATISGNEPENYDYNGLKSPVMNVQLNGYHVDARVVLNQGASPECTARGQFKNWTSIYAEIGSQEHIPFGDTGDYFSRADTFSKTLMEQFVDAYTCMMGSNVEGLFEFKLLGADVPADHSMRRNILVTSEILKSYSKGDIRKFLNEDPVALAVWGDISKIHGEAGEEKYHESRIMYQDGIHGKATVAYLSSIKNEGIVWTGFSDMTTPTRMMDCIDVKVEGLTHFNRFGRYQLNLDKA